MEREERLAVAALKDGTVIDHIPSEALFKVVRILDIPAMEESVTIGFNLKSTRLGKKGIIKVAGREFPQDVINRIAVVAPGAVINIIRDYKVEKKNPVVLPENLVGLVKCSNAKCVTNHEKIPTRFNVIASSPVTVCCHYCGREITGDDITLV